MIDFSSGDSMVGLLCRAQGTGRALLNLILLPQSNGHRQPRRQSTLADVDPKRNTQSQLIWPSSPRVPLAPSPATWLAVKRVVIARPIV